MKAVIVIDMPDGVNVDDYYVGQILLLNKGIRDFPTEEAGIQYYDLPLVPLPNEMTEGFDRMFMCGWNSCLEVIEGETE